MPSPKETYDQLKTKYAGKEVVFVFARGPQKNFHFEVSDKKAVKALISEVKKFEKNVEILGSGLLTFDSGKIHFNDIDAKSDSTFKEQLKVCFRKETIPFKVVYLEDEASDSEDDTTGNVVKATIIQSGKLEVMFGHWAKHLPRQEKDIGVLEGKVAEANSAGRFEGNAEDVKSFASFFEMVAKENGFTLESKEQETIRIEKEENKNNRIDTNTKLDDKYHEDASSLKIKIDQWVVQHAEKYADKQALEKFDELMSTKDSSANEKHGSFSASRSAFIKFSGFKFLLGSQNLWPTAFGIDLKVFDKRAYQNSIDYVETQMKHWKEKSEFSGETHHL